MQKKEQQEALHQRLAEMQQEAIEYREKVWKQRQQELKLKFSFQAGETSIHNKNLEPSKDVKNCSSEKILTNKEVGVQNEASRNVSSENVKSVSYVEQENDVYINTTPILDLPASLSPNTPKHVTSRHVGTENVVSQHTTCQENMHMVKQIMRDAIPLIRQNTEGVTVSSPPIPIDINKQRTNAETLDDKWQVCYLA